MNNNIDNTDNKSKESNSKESSNFSDNEILTPKNLDNIELHFSDNEVLTPKSLDNIELHKDSFSDINIFDNDKLTSFDNTQPIEFSAKDDQFQNDKMFKADMHSKSLTNLDKPLMKAH